MQYKENVSYGLSHDSKRLEVLHECLHAAKAATEAFLAFTPDRYIGVNVLFSVLFRHSTQTLYRLSALKDPCWDAKIVQDTVDVVHCLERAIERFQDAAVIAGSAGLIPTQVFFDKAVSGLKNSVEAWKYELGLSGNGMTPVGFEENANAGEILGLRSWTLLMIHGSFHGQLRRRISFLNAKKRPLVIKSSI